MRLNGVDEGDVTWTGHLPHSEVSKLLSVCDLMILPFLGGVSTRRTSAVTALQHGLPLLTTRGIGQEPWFVHGKNAYTVPAGDGPALAQGLVDLARKPELRAQLAEGARALFRASFAWDVIAQRVAGLAGSAAGP
jgi:glycosyltransferase involved in cell wall biosynthesis